MSARLYWRFAQQTSRLRPLGHLSLIYTPHLQEWVEDKRTPLLEVCAANNPVVPEAQR